MKHSAIPALLLVLVLGLGCGGGGQPQPDPKSPPKIEIKPDPPGTTPAAPRAEPDHVTVAHILISFAGTRTNATRSKADAEKLAGDVLARVKKGEDFDKLMKDYSDDPGAGVYTMSNRGVRPAGGEMPRVDMVPAFGDVGFKLDVGQVAMAEFEAKKSPFGWHIIKRLK